MNRLILGLAIGVALCGPAFAMNEFGVAPNAASPTVNSRLGKLRWHPCSWLGI